MSDIERTFIQRQEAEAANRALNQAKAREKAAEEAEIKARIARQVAIGNRADAILQNVGVIVDRTSGYSFLHRSPEEADRRAKVWYATRSQTSSPVYLGTIETDGDQKWVYAQVFVDKKLNKKDVPNGFLRGTTEIETSEVDRVALGFYAVDSPLTPEQPELAEATVIAGNSTDGIRNNAKAIEWNTYKELVKTGQQEELQPHLLEQMEDGLSFIEQKTVVLF